jgi:hypothetical protein
MTQMHARTLALLIWAALGVSLAGCRGGSASPAGQVATSVRGISVGTQSWVSKANADIEIYEVLAGVDPENTDHMIACTTVFDPKTNARSNIVYISADRGVTWSSTLHDTATVFTGDPACTFGLNGDTYYAGLPIFGGPHLTNNEHVFESRDYGKTWKLIVNRPFQDREYITVDHTHSPYRGNVYLYADGIGVGKDGWDIFRIVNGKLTEPVMSPDSKRFLSMNASEGAITPNGTLVVPFEGWPLGGSRGTAFEFGIIRSPDGGKTLARALILGNECAAGATLTNAAVDTSGGPFNGRVYTTYSATSGNHCVLAVVHSDDNGKTWSKPALIQEAGPRHGFPLAPVETEPTLSVNNGGVVGLSWYDTRDDPANKFYKLRFAASYDGGESFTQSVAVSPYAENILGSHEFYFGADAASGGASSSRHPGTSDPILSRTGPDWMTIDTPGDTRSMIVDSAGVFHPFWTQNPTGSPQLYTVPIRVSGRAYRNGDQSLQGYKDVTSQVALSYTATNFDPATSTINLHVTLMNRSNVPIHGPVKMRMLWATSTAGLPAVIDAENGLSGPGAIWSFTSALYGGRLAPWTQSRPISVVFRVADLDQSRMVYPLVEFASRVYAAK